MSEACERSDCVRNASVDVDGAAHPGLSTQGKKIAPVMQVAKPSLGVRTRLVGLLILIASAATSLMVTAEPNHDVTWLWLATDRLLSGGTLGGNVWEPNPPLIFWIMTPAVVSAKLLGADHHLAYTIWITGLATVAAFVAAEIARPIFPDSRRSRLFACALLSCLAFLPGENFGQREHILIILITPYLIWECCAQGRETPLRLDLA